MQNENRTRKYVILCLILAVLCVLIGIYNKVFKNDGITTFPDFSEVSPTEYVEKIITD